LSIAYLNPKTGSAIGYQETKGTTAEPFFAPMLWQPSSLSYVTAKADAGGNLYTVSGAPTITPLAPATYGVTNSSTQALAANANRTGLVITLVGGTIPVFFAQGATAVLNSGIMLAPNGTWVMDRYTFYTGAINVICSGGATIAIQEYQ
jgi:hypothetical protein